MNNEIKEILEDVKIHLDYVESTKQASIRDNEMKAMYDYITNLEQENERVSDLYSAYEEANELWINKCENYKSRIDKAYKVLDEITFFTTPIGQVVHLDMIISDIKKVKSILKGSDNNE